LDLGFLNDVDYGFADFVAPPGSREANRRCPIIRKLSVAKMAIKSKIGLEEIKFSVLSEVSVGFHIELCKIVI
jgi:hypothetical protein